MINRRDFLKLWGIMPFLAKIIEAKDAFRRRPIEGLYYNPAREDGKGRIYLPGIEEVRNDLGELARVTSRIKVIGTEEVLGEIPKLCKEYGLECYIGARISRDAAENELQIERLIEIGKPNRNISGLIIGEGALGRGDIRESDLTEMIERVKGETGLSVTASENWQIYRDRPFAERADLLMVNINAYNEGIAVQDAASYVLQQHELIREKYPGKQIIIGETGWPTQGRKVGNAVAGRENQNTFLRGFVSIARQNGINYTIRTAFDGPEKDSEGNVLENRWGIFTTGRTMKESLTGILEGDLKITGCSKGGMNVRTYPGNSYSVQASSDCEGSYRKVGEFTGTDGTNTTSVAFPGKTQQQRFFRVKMN